MAEGEPYFPKVPWITERSFLYSKGEGTNVPDLRLTNMVDEQEMNRFSDLIKKMVLLDVLERALQWDHRWLKQSPLKTSRAWMRLLLPTLEQIRRDRKAAEKEIHRAGGRILEIRQRQNCREVTVVYRGYRYTMRYLNGWIRSECDDLLLYFWTGKTTSEQTPPKETH